MARATSLEIPLREGEEVIDIPFDDLPEASEILQILQQVCGLPVLYKVPIFVDLPNL